LRRADKIIVLGDSLTDADIRSQRLFREVIRQNTSLASITLVLGTNEEGDGRWEALCRDCRKVPVRTLLTFEDFITSQSE